MMKFQEYLLYIITPLSGEDSGQVVTDISYTGFLFLSVKWNTTYIQDGEII